MNTPIEMLLDGLEWQEVGSQGDFGYGLPVATHEGVLELAGHKLRCYRLDNGQAIFHAEDMQALIGATVGGEGE